MSTPSPILAVSSQQKLTLKLKILLVYEGYHDDDDDSIDTPSWSINQTPFMSQSFIKLSFNILTVLFIIVFNGVHIRAEEKCRSPTIFRIPMMNKSLLYHQIKSLQATDEGHCRALCFMNHRCLSLNYIGSLCTLSDSDHVLHPEDMVMSRETVYWSIEV